MVILFIVVFIVVVIFLLTGGFRIIDNKNKRKKGYGNFEGNDQYKILFETKKKAWFSSKSNIVYIDNYEYNEIINSFPFFTNFEQTIKFLEKNKISLTKQKEIEEDLKKIEKTFKDIFLKADNKLINDFNSFNLVMNQQTVEYFSSNYIIFLEEGYKATISLLYKNVIPLIIRYAFDNSNNGEKYNNEINHIASEYTQRLMELVFKIKNKITTDIENQYREAFQNFFNQFTGQNNQNYNQYQSVQEQESELDIAYKTLGVDKTISNDELKKTYRKLAIQYHPDKNKDENSKTKMMEINSAYTIIKKYRNIK